VGVVRVTGVISTCENFATASHQCTGVIDELVNGQLVDYTYEIFLVASGVFVLVS